MNYSRWRGPDRPVSNGSHVTRLRLDPDEDAPRAARAALAPLRVLVENEVFERAELLAAEIATNATKHGGGGEVTLEIWSTGGIVSVTAFDDGPGFVATARNGNIAELEGGFGLPLLDTLSTAWGNGSDTGSWVWFEVGPAMAAVGEARPDVVRRARYAKESTAIYRARRSDRLGVAHGNEG